MLRKNFIYFIKFFYAPDAMLKSVVGSPRINVVIPPQLLDVAKPLKLRSVDDFYQKWMKFNKSVDRIHKALIQKT